MWSEVIDKVKDKFASLRGKSWDAFVDEDTAHQEKIIHLYETLTWEMVEGITSLFLEMVSNLNYISKRIYLENPRVYEDMHVLIIEKLEESTHPDIKTIPQFYLHIKSAVDSFGTYLKFIKQDISMYYSRQRYKRMDRKIRQLNLVLKELLEGFKDISQSEISKVIADKSRNAKSDEEYFLQSFLEIQREKRKRRIPRFSRFHRKEDKKEEDSKKETKEGVSGFIHSVFTTFGKKKRNS